MLIYPTFSVPISVKFRKLILDDILEFCHSLGNTVLKYVNKVLIYMFLALPISVPFHTGNMNSIVTDFSQIVLYVILQLTSLQIKELRT